LDILCFGFNKVIHVRATSDVYFVSTAKALKIPLKKSSASRLMRMQ